MLSVISASPPLKPPKLSPGKEFEGLDLHDAVVRGSGPHYTYNDQLFNATSHRKNMSRDIVGSFTCHNCTYLRRRAHTWPSGVICTQVFFTPDGQYRTILHAQQCRRCEAYVEPVVNEDNYVKKIVSALDLWTGRRERLRPKWDEDEKETPPHDKKRCHGCQIGVCTRKLTPGKEFEGSYLHAVVARESDDRYKYDQNLTKPTSGRSRSKNIVGHFLCNSCTPAYEWESGIICTELFLGSNDRYRTILHAQQCRRCKAFVKPDVDEENYVKRVVRALDLWTGRREPQKQLFDESKATGRHDDKLCHGCQIGVCNGHSMKKSIQK
ncbi:hypothetical protein BGZ96_004022 [Linnemannia gamsii]|uniref:3CxxC-type domain-containing protein n=1 Tax=Linnemannia gamsii TaxID=64522 RepID=A0ABQ7K732_9FUNG|nr:hypothetical protein BGZ96_004022 [Linnemannia gamsii]